MSSSIPKVNMQPGEEKLARYAAFDPGDTWGWATFNGVGDVIAMGQFPWKGDVQTINNLLEDHIVGVICEDYRNFAWMQQKKWSRNQTSKGIGKLETLCELKKIPIVLQPSNVLEVGLMWAGLGKLPSNHSISHQYSAVGHGVYWLQQNGIRPVGRAMLGTD